MSKKFCNQCGQELASDAWSTPIPYNAVLKTYELKVIV